MFRRALSFMFLALVVVQLLGGVAMASVCLEPCPDDAERTSCPPACALCATCTHSTFAIAGHGAWGTSIFASQRYLPEPPAFPTSHLAADVFHVPLPG